MLCSAADWLFQHFLLMVLYLPFSGLTGIIFSPLASSATSSHIFIPLHNESLTTSSLLPFGGLWGDSESNVLYSSETYVQ